MRAFFNLHVLVKYLIIERREAFRSEFQIDGIDVFHLVRGDFRNSFLGSYLAKEMLTYFGTRKFLEKYGDALKAFIYYLEFHKWERALVMAFEHAGFHQKLIGFQHSTISPMSTNHRFMSTELKEDNSAESLPLPNIITVSGEDPMRQFLDMGFPLQKLRLTGSLRYQAGKRPSRDRTRKTRRVLLVTSIHTEDAVSTIRMTMHACMKCNATLYIKPHPVNDVTDYVYSLAAETGFDDYSIVHTSLENLIDDSDVMVATWTTVTLEALIRGCPVVNISYCHSIDMSLFMSSDDITGMMFASDGGELLEALASFLDHPPVIREEDKELLWTRFFGPRESNVNQNFFSCPTEQKNPFN
jgi:surface carbohydrate biosynthesis protein (TIGR04326 family)